MSRILLVEDNELSRDMLSRRLTRRGYEVLTAFFLEAGFLGVMLFGMGRVGPRLHFTATLLVAVGTLFSAFWIISANSWMHTPGGYAINDVGQFVPVDWWAIIFNASFPYRLVHTVLAAYLTTALVVGAVGAWHLMRDKINEGARVMFTMAMGMMMLPPTSISLPFKILFFVLIDGWNLLVGSLVRSFY